MARTEMTLLNRGANRATNTLHLHFIHQFAVKSVAAVCAEALTTGNDAFRGELR